MCWGHEIAIWSRAAVVAQATSYGTCKANGNSFTHLVSIGWVNATAGHFALRAYDLRDSRLGANGTTHGTRHQQVTKLAYAPPTARAAYEQPVSAPKWPLS